MSATPASMLHIVASGLQDRERLNSPSGSPSVAFYKTVMRRRTRWASQWRRVEFDGLADFGRTAVCTLPIQGELITRATLVIDLPDILTPQANAINQQQETPNKLVGPSWAWTNDIGHAICSEVQMLIGDQIIDRFDSRSLAVLDEHTGPVEHFDSTNLLVARDPSTYTDQQTTYANANVPQTNPQTLEIVFPFWWNRGPGPQALPIQALHKDRVQLKVTFRPIQECVYTSTRIDPRNPPLSDNQGTGPMPNIAGCGFFIHDASSSQLIYNATATPENSYGNPFPGDVIRSPSMPTAYHFTDAYWIVEYVSLEDREAAAYRMADMEIPMEQHVPMPVVTTGGARNIRIRMDQAGLVRDLTWVAQRTEATDYNAYFLYSRDLGPAPGPPTLVGPDPLAGQQNPCDIPWWPNAVLPNWDYGDGYIRPAFVDRRSDPIAVAKMQIRGLSRFEHEGPSIFRSLIPALNCKRCPIIDRYIYRYDFGFWPTGGLAEALDRPVDEIRGCSNWDKLPKRELVLIMNQDNCNEATWAVDTTQRSLTTAGSDAFVSVDSAFSPATTGFIVQLVGATPDLAPNNGNGATVLGIVDFNALRRRPGYIGLFVRTNANGSASLVLQTTAGYTWIAVAGAGGYGVSPSIGGGYAGSAVQIGWQGGNGEQTHADTSDDIYSNFGPLAIVQSGTNFSSQSQQFTIHATGTIHTFSVSYSIPAYFFPSTVQIVLFVNGLPLSVKIIPTQPPKPFQRYTYDADVPVTIGDTVYITIQSSITITAEVNASALACALTATPPGLVSYGGGGGGRLAEAGVGLPDGQQMPTSASFVTSHQQTGGSGFTYVGGDGFFGGGSGTGGGGGGGSYVSELIQQVNTFENVAAAPVSATLTPLRTEAVAPPNFNIYSWVTRYNRLRISGGRGALMFNEAA